jgi:hypothetical protein
LKRGPSNYIFLSSYSSLIHTYNDNAYYVLTTALQCVKTLKPYALSGFEPGIFCSASGRDDHYATPPGQMGRGAFFICQNLSEFVRICQNLSEFVRICQNLSEFVRICQNLSEFVTIFVTIFVRIFICQNYHATFSVDKSR